MEKVGPNFSNCLDLTVRRFQCPTPAPVVGPNISVSVVRVCCGKPGLALFKTCCVVCQNALSVIIIFCGSGVCFRSSSVSSVNCPCQPWRALWGDSASYATTVAHAQVSVILVPGERAQAHKVWPEVDESGSALLALGEKHGKVGQGSASLPSRRPGIPSEGSRRSAPWSSHLVSGRSHATMMPKVGGVWFFVFVRAA